MAFNYTYSISDGAASFSAQTIAAGATDTELLPPVACRKMTVLNPASSTGKVLVKIGYNAEGAPDDSDAFTLGPGDMACFPVAKVNKGARPGEAYPDRIWITTEADTVASVMFDLDSPTGA